MKNIRIVKLTLENFKGVKKLDMPFTTMIQTIRGENHSGKTTIFDAFCWVLFDRDSIGRGGNLGVMRLDEKGDVIHRIDHRVTLTLDVDGRSITLSKNFHEKWTKRKGSVEEVYDGNTVDYSVDEIPCNKSEYIGKVRDIISEDTFRMVTDVLHFSRLHWQDQKKILRDLAGDVKVSETALLAEPLFDNLIKFLSEGHTIDEYAKKIAGLKAPIKKRIDEIPSEITGMQDSIPEDVDTNAIDEAIKTLEEEKLSKQDERNALTARIEDVAARIKAFDVDKENVRGEIEKINLEITNLTQRLTLKDTEKFNDDNIKYLQYRQKTSDYKESINKLKSDRKELCNQIIKDKEDIEAMRNKCMELNDNLKHADEAVCKTCGQTLPVYDIDKLKARYRNDIAEIEKDGVKFAGEIKSKEKQLADLDKRITDTEAEAAALEPVNPPVPTPAPDLSANAEYLTLTQNKAMLEQKIKSMVYTDSTAAYRTQRTVLNNEIEDIEKRIKEQERRRGSLDVKKVILDNIEKKKTELRKQHQELTLLEREEQAIIDYKRLEVETIESAVNSKFALVNFRFYKPLVNGGYEETCECTMHGTPYASLSASEKVNAGLDIINALQKHYDVLAPIFIDNAEGVNEFHHTEAQVVRLYVSADKEITYSNDLI